MESIRSIIQSNLEYRDYSPYSTSVSPFIDEGQFLDHRPPINRNYTLDNFEYLRDCNKELITIGRGGYGKLYLAKNKKDNKEYAIKYVSKKKMQSVGVDYSIIKREIDIHIRITHPRIIKLYSYLEDRYNFYLAMEYAPKGTLYQLIQQKRGMCEEEAFYYFIQVASAIHFLHENGYAHRDIKPENILLDGKGIKLCDFGWCVNVAKGERTTFCGTYEYMAPEMINDEFYDMGIDIWSLGVLLYEMIHGYSPFRANRFIKDAKKAQVEIFINIKNNNYRINKNISSECVDLIDKLLTTDTSKRIKIDELFNHPWVVNKEQEYFPHFKRLKEIKIKSNNNIANSHRRLETDINCIKSLEINIKKLNNNKEKGEDVFENEKGKKLEKTFSPRNNTKKSYCFVYTKGNSINNGIYFIQGKSGNNKNNREEKVSRAEKEEDRNYYEYNKIILTETNEDIIKKKNRNEFSPLMKKEADSNNNFIYSINSKRKKINLPRVMRTEKRDNIENNNLDLKPYESHEIKSINIKLDENPQKQKQSLGLKNHSKLKSDKKSCIRVQKPELDNYIKGQNEINDLNQKIEKIKEKQELMTNKLRKIEEKKRREESLQKPYDSHKSNTSYDYYTKTKRFKNQFLYMNYKTKKEIGSYSIKKLPKERNLQKQNDIKSKISNLREKLKEKRSRSFQQLLTEKSLENKIKNILREKRSKDKANININNNINKKYISNNNVNYNLRKINNIKGEDDISIKESFKRFRKMVVHLKKRNNLNINTEGNMNKSENKIIKSNYPKVYMKTTKAKNSIQNIFYNTFYNCLFNEGQNNNHSNIKNIYMNNNKKKEIKTISSEKNIFKNLFELNNNSKIKSNDRTNNFNLNLNKENEFVNSNTERKRGNLFLNNINNTRQENNIEKKNSNYVYINYKNNLISSGLIQTPSNKKI